MFNKDLVPNGTKVSLVTGRENILKYETMMADDANAERENSKLNLINKASQAVIYLQESPTIWWYNNALEEVSKIEDGEEKQEFLKEISELKETVIIKWKESIEEEIKRLSRENYLYLNRNSLKSLEHNIEEGFDETTKAEYNKKILVFKAILDEKDEKTRVTCKTIVIVIYIILSLVIIYELIKIIMERKSFKGEYYREFPGEYSPAIIEYLMKRRITNLSISATILDLIAKKIIKLEEITDNKKDAKLILNKPDEEVSPTEFVVLDILFHLVGDNNICTLEELKNYGKTEYKANLLRKKVGTFKEEAKKEVKSRKYFNNGAILQIIKTIICIAYIFSLLMTIGIFKNIENASAILLYIFAISIITILFLYITHQYKNRTKEGREEYSKWLAHKRFLKDFSKFDEKDLPEIALWEKYLVTATILGCADKVQKKMKLYINNSTETDIYTTDYFLIDSVISSNFTKTISESINKSISTANLTAGSSSSGGGFGGGSSFGGGRRPDGGGGGGRF